jgi:putative ABC transport system permease protein
MNISEAVNMSLQALRANRLRTFLTALGLIIGNASVILVVTISLASRDMILDVIRGVGSNLVWANYEAGGQNTAKVEADFVKLADVQAIRDTLGNEIVSATAVMPNSDQIVVNGKIRQVTINGVDENYARVRNIVILTGRSFEESDITLRERVAILSDKLAIRIFGNLQAALGQTIKISQLQFTVIGTFREKTSTMGNADIGEETILIPISVMRTFTPFERVEPVYIQVRNATDVPLVTEQVKQILQRRHRPGASYNVQNLKAVLDAADSIATVLTIVLIIVSTIALVISGIGIMNIMLATLSSRIREIGIRKAMGATNRSILYQFLSEAVLISLLGGLTGVIIGLAIPYSVRFLTEYRLPISGLSAIVAIGVSSLVGILFGTVPATRAAKLDPVESLRYE